VEVLTCDIPDLREVDGRPGGQRSWTSRTVSHETT